MKRDIQPQDVSIISPDIYRYSGWWYWFFLLACTAFVIFPAIAYFENPLREDRMAIWGFIIFSGFGIIYTGLLAAKGFQFKNDEIVVSNFIFRSIRRYPIQLIVDLDFFTGTGQAPIQKVKVLFENKKSLTFYLMGRQMHRFFAVLREISLPVLRRRLEKDGGHSFRARIGRYGAAERVIVRPEGFEIDTKKGINKAKFTEIESWMELPNGMLLIKLDSERKIELYPFIERFLDATGFTMLVEKLPPTKRTI